MSADKTLRKRVCDGERLFANVRGVLEMVAVLTPVVIWLGVWATKPKAFSAEVLDEFCKTMYCKYYR